MRVHCASKGGGGQGGRDGAGAEMRSHALGGAEALAPGGTGALRVQRLWWVGKFFCIYNIYKLFE